MTLVPKVDAEAATLIAPRWSREEEPTPSDRQRFAARYQEGELLGEGGMGSVAMHLDTWIGRPVALKVLHPGLQQDVGMRNRFLREARIQGQLEHPSIVPVYDLGEDRRGHPYFTMRRVQGRTLAEVVEARGSAAGRDAKLLGDFVRICLAVHYAHERGVIHRDLKPSNVMLGEFGEIYVLDWGIARMIDESSERPPIDDHAIADYATRDGDVMGTPGYMAPEQVAADLDQLSTATDVYALGVMLFEILTETNPHRGTTPQELLFATVAGVTEQVDAVARTADLPPELVALCRAALELDPEQRLGSAKELADGIDGYLAGERDLALRQRLAAEHAAAAAAMFAQGQDLEQRRRAMGEVGRALALDPGNRRAADIMLELLETPPRDVPDDVHAESERGFDERLRSVGRFATLTYLGMLGFLPLVYVVGVRNVWPFVGYFGGCCIAAALSFRASRTASQSLTLLALAISSAACAATAGIYGSLIVAPQAVVINVILYFFVLKRRYLAFALCVGIAAITAPILLELANVTASYRVVDGGMLIAEQGLALGRRSMLLFGMATAVFGLISGAVAAAFYHNRLAVSESQLFLREWHLRQMVNAPRSPG